MKGYCLYFGSKFLGLRTNDYDTCEAKDVENEWRLTAVKDLMSKMQLKKSSHWPCVIRRQLRMISITMEIHNVPSGDTAKREHILYKLNKKGNNHTLLHALSKIQGSVHFTA